LFKRDCFFQQKNLIFKQPIDKIFAFEHLSAFITKNRDLYISNEENDSILIDKNVLKVDANDEFLIYTKLENELNLMVWFYDDCHLSFVKNLKTKTPICIQQFNNENVEFVAGNKCLCYLNEGVPYIMGDNLYNHLSPNLPDFVEEITPLNFYNIKKIALSKNPNSNQHFFLKTNGEVFTNKNEKILENILDISYNWGHILLLKNDLSLWGMGDNTYKQIEEDDSEIIHTPRLIDKNVSKIKAGKHFSLYENKTGEVYVKGLNQFGNLSSFNVGESIGKSSLFENNFKLNINIKKNSEKIHVFFKKLPELIEINLNEIIFLELQVSNPLNHSLIYKWYINDNLIKTSISNFLVLDLKLFFKKINLKSLNYIKVDVYVGESLSFSSKSVMSLLDINSFKNKKNINVPIML